MPHTCASSYTHRVRTYYEDRTVTAPRPPSHEEIAKLAYLFWEQRGRHGGTPWADWFRAEQELRARARRY